MLKLKKLYEELIYSQPEERVSKENEKSKEIKELIERSQEAAAHADPLRYHV